MSITKRGLLGLACAALIGSAPLAAMADGWKPRKPIDFVIMAGAGGGADQIARFIQSVAELVLHHAHSSGKSWHRHSDLHAGGNDGRRSFCSVGAQRQRHNYV